MPASISTPAPTSAPASASAPLPVATIPPAEHRCQIHRTLDVVGEKWSLLIVRNALRGQSTFSEFRSSLGIPTDVLTARLSSLVASGILEKEAYREPGSRERFRYVPTEAGVGLRLVLAAMIQWGDEFEPSPYGPASLVTDAATGAPAQLEARTREGIRVDAKHIAIVPGPASLTTW